jgi:Leucine-rich repeat (LRR) protein
LFPSKGIKEQQQKGLFSFLEVGKSGKCLHLIDFSKNMTLKISQKEQQKLSGLKELDIQQCSFCRKTNLLNLG